MEVGVHLGLNCGIAWRNFIFFLIFSFFKFYQYTLKNFQTSQWRPKISTEIQQHVSSPWRGKSPPQNNTHISKHFRTAPKCVRQKYHAEILSRPHFVVSEMCYPAKTKCTRLKVFPRECEFVPAPNKGHEICCRRITTLQRNSSCGQRTFSIFGHYNFSAKIGSCGVFGGKYHGEGCAWECLAECSENKLELFKCLINNYLK